ncbi:hypothetical protein [Thermococcus sp. MV11]|uniref:hypothetical protein n=1 Tax=Thermococcus sp. MV11 TaxID=1638267 RepID=UPI001431D27D|nr:hypothetical protein [Thermococcus sp. MV11]
MEWEELKRRIEGNPFLLGGLFAVLLGLFSGNATLIWIGVFFVLLLILLGEA